MKSSSVRYRHANAGIGLVTAIFLVVVLASLGAAMVAAFNTQHTAVALDVQGARAYQAARAGIEWGVYQQLRNNSCAANSSFAMPAAYGAVASSLAGFTVTVSCRSVPGPGGAAALTRRVIRATACNQAAGGACPNPTQSLDYVQRVVEVQL